MRKTMNKYWLEKLEGRLPPRLEQAVKNADKAIQDLALQFHLSYWHPISTAPYNQELELRIVQVGEIAPLEFPCLQTNAGQWINVDLGSGINISPVEWRVWQRRKSPQPHYSRIRPSDRSSLFHRDLAIIGQGATD
jgi:hypothetical protein